jgi:hypothetical protein
MKDKSSMKNFQEVHKKIKDKKDALRKASEDRSVFAREEAEKELLEKGFDRPATDPLI